MKRNENKKKTSLKSKNWLNILPRGTSSKIKKELGSEISLRTIQLILSGSVEDNYGVLIIAAKIWKQILKKRQQGKIDLEKIHASISSSSN